MTGSLPPSPITAHEIIVRGILQGVDLGPDPIPAPNSAASKFGLTTKLVVAGTVSCVVAGPLAATAAVAYLGFGSAGIAAGSWAAGLMSSYGGAVTAGSLCATLQSVGAAGLGTAGTIATAAAGGTVGAATGGVTGMAANIFRKKKFTEIPVCGVTQMAENFYRLELDLEDHRALRSGYTIPGQYVQIQLGDGETASNMFMGSPPKRRDRTWLFFVEDVAGTTADVLCSLKTVRVSRVLGNGFAIKRLCPPDDAVLLFATGSGISPIRAFIEEGTLDVHLRRSQVILCYGIRTGNVSVYKVHLFEENGVTTNELTITALADQDGQTFEHVFAESKNKFFRFDPLHTCAVVCGDKKMIADVTSLLVIKGVPQAKILTLLSEN